MSKLRISDAPLLSDVNGSEKIPTGGRGDLAISMEQVKTFAQGGLPQQIEDHINDTENPHQVSKSQVGLGNVDNTSDLNKPVSVAQQEALNLKADKVTTYTKIEVDSRLGLKADKTYVDSSLDLKADKTAVHSKSETLPTYYIKEDGVNSVTGVVDGAYFNVRSTDNATMLDEYQNVGGSAVATGKSYPSSAFVQNVVEQQDQVNQAQALFNDKYSKFKQPEVGAVEQDLSIRSRKKQYITDFSNAQQAFDVKRNAATYSYIPNQTYQISGSLVLSGPHFIEGQGDYSILKFSGAGNGITRTAGSKYDDHAHSTIQNIRIDGDRITSPSVIPGTTRGLSVVSNGHAGEVKGVTFNGHDTGYYLNKNYTSRGSYNMYRANRIGLHLDSVTSYREESIYARYNTEAAVLITGSNQNITFAGGAIEGNSGRAIWARDLVVNSNMQITLDDVYLEVNGNEALGIPSVELQEIEKMEIIVNGGSYWYNLNNGVYSGPYMWGNSVSFHGSSLQGYHYAKKVSLNNVLQAPIMNTAKGLTTARSFGLREPAIVSVFTPQTFSPTVFQIPFVTGKPPKIIGYTNNAIQTYPFSSLGSGVTRSEDTINDYGDGKLEKLSFSDTGNYNATYATLFTTAHSANNMSVYVFALVPETDCEIGLIAADSATRDSSYFSLKGGVKYKFVRTFNGLAGTTERLRMFSINGACSVSFKPIAVYQFNDNGTSNAFIKSLSTPAEKFTPAVNQADSVATDVAGLKADFNALLTKLKASGQML